MSKISTIHDGIVTLTQATLPAYQQLPNPYEVAANNERYLTQGFGVAVGPAQRTDRQIGCQFSWEREFSIPLTKQVTATDHNITQRETISKDLLEDHYTLTKAIEKDVSLDASTINFRIISDSGIQFLELEDSGRYFVMIIDILAEYMEDFT